MSENPIPTAKPASGRGLRIALAVSVAFNLAVIGVIGGAMLRPDGPGGPPGPRDLGFGIYSDALTPENRSDLRRRYIQSKPGLLQERRAMRQDTAALIAALRADPFDPAALDAAMQAQIARLQNRLSTGQALMRGFLMDLTPQDRRAFADRLEAATSRHKPPRADN